MISLIRNYIRYNGGVLSAIRKLFHAVFTLLATRGLHGLYRQWRETRLRMQRIEREKRLNEALANHHSSGMLRILATKHTTYIAHMLDAQFCTYGISSEIIIDLQHIPDNNTVYVVICAQMFTHIPRHMIAFQMEQCMSDRWFDRKYLDRLAKAIAVLDYSLTNIEYLQCKGIPSSLFYLHKVHPISNYRLQLEKHGTPIAHPDKTRYDAVFYGDIHCDRRRNILAELSKRFRILIISDLFGPELYAALLSAKVVLNIHYYDPALLETTRICECVSLGMPVISERGMPSDEHHTWGDRVRYVPVGDVHAMAEEIERQIRQPELVVQSYQASAQDSRANAFNAARLLGGCGLLAPSEIRKVQPPITLDAQTPICLSLPETPHRRAHAIKTCISPPQYFDGLRHVQAWKGCALSYSYLASLALKQKLSWLEVYEDDCKFFPGSLNSLESAKRYLNINKKNWDIFSAMVTTIPNGMKINKIEIFDGLKFVHLNRTMGMVYSIFNSTLYPHLAEWNASIDDAATNTIDKYLATKDSLRVVTCLPYIVGHQEDIESSLWGFGNDAYTDLINTSQKQLEKLVTEFQAASRAHTSH